MVAHLVSAGTHVVRPKHIAKLFKVWPIKPFGRILQWMIVGVQVEQLQKRMSLQRLFPYTQVAVSIFGKIALMPS